MSKNASKFRHIFGDPAKPEKQFLEIKQPLTAGEGEYVCANSRFFAVARNSGGGPVYIRKHTDVGRFPANTPQLSVQKGKVWDMRFNPFIDNMIATGSDDCSVCLSTFPFEGLTDNLDEAAVRMTGHAKKVCLVRFNPSAENILASGSFDATVKVWDSTTAECVNTLEQFKDVVYSVEWSGDGSRLACTSKDKKMRIYDPRAPDDVTEFESFDGAKSSKCFWVNKFGWVGAVGFSKTSKRQLKVWDLKNLEKPLYSNNIDQAASVLMPHMDDDLGVLYLAGKGEGAIQFHECKNDDRLVHQLGAYRNPEPQKGGGWLPKKGLDPWKCEVQRFLKLTQKKIIPISFIVPRKVGADVFQEDIYPESAAGKAALNASEWLEGTNKEPITMSLDPSKRDDADAQPAEFVAKKSYAELEKENEELAARVAELEAKLGIEAPAAEEEAEAKDDE